MINSIQTKQVKQNNYNKGIYKYINFRQFVVGLLSMYILLIIVSIYLVIFNPLYLKILVFGPILFEGRKGASVNSILYWNPFTTKVELGSTEGLANRSYSISSLRDHNTISTGEYFADGIDAETFEIIGSCKEDMKGNVCYAKDKGSYYRIEGIAFEQGKVGSVNVFKIEESKIGQYTDFIEYGGGYYSRDWSMYFNDKPMIGVDILGFKSVSSIDGCSKSKFYTNTHSLYLEGEYFNPLENDTYFMISPSREIECGGDGLYIKLSTGEIYFQDRMLDKKMSGSIESIGNLKLLEGKYGEDYISKYDDDYPETSLFYCGAELIGWGYAVEEEFDSLDAKSEHVYHLEQQNGKQYFICNQGELELIDVDDVDIQAVDSVK